MNTSPALQLLCLAEHPLDRKLFLEYATLLGWSTALADRPESAIRLTAEQPFDLIVVDQDMTLCSGIDAVLSIRSGGMLNRRTPVVLFTVDLDRDVLDAARSHGIYSCLQKPVLMTAFQDAAGDALAGIDPRTSSRRQTC